MTLQLQAAFPRLRVLPTAFLASGFEQLAYIDAFIWVISLAALIVGAIGVLNTMLMSVSERVREIGTLRAFGWPRAMVMRLILGEGLVTSLLGGVGGSLLGVVGAELLMKMVPQGILEPLYGPAHLRARDDRRRPARPARRALPGMARQPPRSGRGAPL